MDASSSLKAGFPFLWGAWSKFAAITATYPLQVEFGCNVKHFKGLFDAPI